MRKGRGGELRSLQKQRQKFHLLPPFTFLPLSFLFFWPIPAFSTTASIPLLLLLTTDKFCLPALKKIAHPSDPPRAMAAEEEKDGANLARAGRRGTACRKIPVACPLQEKVFCAQKRWSFGIRAGLLPTATGKSRLGNRETRDMNREK